MADRDAIALEIANRIGGKVTARSSATKKQQHNQLYRAAREGIDIAGEERKLGKRLNLASPDKRAEARKVAEQCLMRRLPSADFSKREILRSRIALIRSGQGDNCPEVESALIVLTGGAA